MNQAHSTYQTDFTPYDWLQNNVIPDVNFCSSENVDECLKYISQEFSALGYPSIYSNSSDRPFSVNCDIVKFLNATFELLRSNTERTQTKEDLESRNQRLSSDLNSLSKKNSVLKSTLEQNEKKLASSFERERQLKEKIEQISQLLKSEKDENRKITAQLRQQKVAYQHEIRKHENNMNHIKTKLNQLLSDKNPSKKIASITSSQCLPRNSGQRGKWKTSTAATTAMEEMYNSVISAYESRSKDLCKDLNSFRQCMHSVILRILEIISILQGEIDGKDSSTTLEEFAFNEIKKESKDIQSFEEKFKYLLGILVETATKKICNIKKNLEDQIIDLKLNLSAYEKTPESCSDSPQVNDTKFTSNSDGKVDAKSHAEEYIKSEKMKLEAEKLAISKLLENIEKEKAELSVQKLTLLRLAIQQKSPTSSWHHSLTTLPSISVITSPNESQRISSSSQLKTSFSTPEQVGLSNRSLSPQWVAGEQAKEVFSRSSDSTLLKGSSLTVQSTVWSPVTSTAQSTFCTPMSADIIFSNSDLPSWANKTEAQNIGLENVLNTTLEVKQSVSGNEIELPSEEMSMMRLKAAMEDIEKRRNTS